MTLLSRTKDMAKLRGMSLETLALKAGLSNKSIYNWDRNSPKSDNLEKVATILNVSTDYLLGRTDNTHANEKSDKVIYLDKALSDESVVIKFQGREMSQKAKRVIIEILNLFDE
ncbi:XRE family transcriptional regulator [Leuconostoc falkenbergense]|uniref:helix-turn-helix domain-containing protein n=1 Tax=Leuconostoc falkenbergense TaxID=2766470 RepID=UPI0021AAC8E5|nr:helix-turn-helix transcriptional regulator [Leuconostoc falkenbergense]MCT4419684.1 XRE family transcriptional regulator [Leuconostoc falkenbergense]